jgi:hypothetical protein
MTRQGEEKTLDDTMGIDVSKDTPDAYWLSKRQHKQFADTKMGLSRRIRWLWVEWFGACEGDGLTTWLARTFKLPSRRFLSGPEAVKAITA